MRNSNLTLGNFVPAFITIIGIICLFQIPNVAMYFVKSPHFNVMMLFTVQHNIAYSSIGLYVMLAILSISAFLAIFSSSVASFEYSFKNDHFNARYFCISVCNHVLEAVSILGIMITIESLSFIQDWPITIVTYIYWILEIMSVLSFGAISIRATLRED